mgnify:CR=1 FL=1
MLYIKIMTKSHNSCKTCNMAKSNLYCHVHVMLVTMFGYEQNPLRGVGGVGHTRVRDVRTEKCKSKNKKKEREREREREKERERERERERGRE